MRLGKYAKLIISILGCELAGVLGSVFTIPAISTWYNVINKPGFTPPGWLFGPVWIALYALMGLAAGLVWILGARKKGIRPALMAFDIQIALNVLWSFLFFGLRNPLYGLLDIITLWLAIAATIVGFYRLSKRAAWLLVPYLLWVSIALLLNLYVWRLN
jgi:tryptophan-rich sensory protein